MLSVASESVSGERGVLEASKTQESEALRACVNAAERDRRTDEASGERQNGGNKKGREREVGRAWLR